MEETYNVTYTLNGNPISFEELDSLQLHNGTIQAIYDTVNARLMKNNVSRQK